MEKREKIQYYSNYYLRRYFYNPINRLKLKNKDFSIIASNCNGGIISHDLGLRFNSPFVNLWIRSADFNRMLTSLQQYMSEELLFTKVDGIDYPCAYCGDVLVYFMHYHSEEQANQKWEERKTRINYDNLFVISTDIDATQKDLEQFDSVLWENKVIFTHLPHPEIKSSFYISGREHLDSVGILSDYRPGISGHRYFDEFDYVNWFNEKLK